MDGELQPQGIIGHRIQVFSIGIIVIAGLLQGIPVVPQASGTVSGVVKDLDGKPAAGVRVSAMARQEGPQQTSAVALASLAETDQAGRYTIENIPPGQYYIVAGSIDRPTYFPGTQDIAGGKVIQVTAGMRAAGFDFTVIDATRSVVPFGLAGVQLSLRVVAETGSRLPVVSPAGPLVLEFERVPDRNITTVPALTAAAFLQVPNPTVPTQFRVKLMNLPEGFLVRSTHYDGVDITASGVLSMPSLTSSQAGLQNIAAVVLPLRPAAISGGLVVTVAEVTPSSSGGGVRITGIGRRSDSHPVFLSGKPGAVFSDGTFEFRGVAPGRHTIALINPGRALGTTLIVGNTDLENISLDEIAALPLDIQSQVEPGPVGNVQPGTKILPVAIRGHVRDRQTGQAPPSGLAWIGGRNSPSYHLDADGRFEFSGLLPGTYKLEVQVSGYAQVTRQLTVDVQDLSVEIQLDK